MDCGESYEISKHELLFMIRMIETVTMRGGYRANELKDIGMVYDSLKDTLNKPTVKDDNNDEETPNEYTL